MRFQKYGLLFFTCLSALVLSFGLQAVTAEPAKRYRIDPPMMVHLRNLEQTVKSARPSSVEEHHRVAESLQSDIKKLIQSCSMKGEAHDALHDWLVPFINGVDEYSGSNEPKELSRHLKELRQTFKPFNASFE